MSPNNRNRSTKLDAVLQTDRSSSGGWSALRVAEAGSGELQSEQSQQPCGFAGQFGCPLDPPAGRAGEVSGRQDSNPAPMTVNLTLVGDRLHLPKTLVASRCISSNWICRTNSLIAEPASHATDSYQSTRANASPFPASRSLPMFRELSVLNGIFCLSFSHFLRKAKLLKTRVDRLGTKSYCPPAFDGLTD